MPEVICVVCGEKFTANRSTKMYCGCDEKRRPLGGFVTVEERERRPMYIWYENERANSKIKEEMRRNPEKNFWEVTAGEFTVTVTYGEIEAGV